MRVFIFLLFTFNLYSVQGQLETKYYSNLNQEDNNLPTWITLMYSDNPDPGIVVNEYEKYYKTHEFVKSEHTQYYKRWLKSITREVELSPKNNRRPNSGSRIPDWTCIGPWDWDHDAAGRSYAPGSSHVYAVEQSISNPNILYAGTATAGIWKTINRGDNWTPCTYDYDVNGVYALEIDHTNPNIVFASMLSSVYKSIDGGLTWSPTGDASFQAISLNVKDIAMDPNDNQIIFIASVQGFYRSTDAGSNWTLINGTSHQEIEFHPINNDTIYTVRQSGDQTFFARSFNNGVSFTQVGSGWPVPIEEQKRAEIAVSLDEPDYVFAHLTGKENGGSGLYGIYKSSDLGSNWTFECCGPQPAGVPDLSTVPPNINIMAWSKEGTDNGGQYYYNVAFGVSPFNADSLWAAGTNMWHSSDGGATFICTAKWSEPGQPDYVHADVHDFHYYAHTGEIWVANDGGIFKSTDNGATFIRKNNGIEGADFWGFGQGFWEGDIMLGGTYHNGTLLKENNVYINDWICTDGGDGNYGMVNPGRPKNVHGWFNIKDLKSDRTIAPVTRNNPHEANASYITGEDSDIIFHPNYYDTWWVGSDTAIYKTIDNGFTFEYLHDFGNKVVAMEISMSNPDILYASTWPGWWSKKELWRTVDGGYTWTNITPSDAQLVNNNWVPYDIVVDPLDGMKVTIVRTSMYSGTNLDAKRVFTSSNGGDTWVNISGTSMNGEPATVASSQYGADGGLIIGTRKGMWYKDNSLSDFINISSDLPLSTFSEKIYPYYRKQKIRTATNRSVWERPFPQPSTRVIANLGVSKKEYYCNQDTVSFVDLSIVSEVGITYNWQFQGGTPLTSTQRKPKVIYECPGEYDVTLTVSDINGSDTKTFDNVVTILNDCDAVEEPGLSLNTKGAGDYGLVNDFALSTNTMTISAWVKPNGIQQDYTGIFMNDGVTAGLNFREGNNTLGYHWPNGSWSWDSNLIAPPNQWSHVAMVITPSNITLYLNGKSATHSVSTSIVDFTTIRVGSYKGWNDRNFKGDIDEVCIYDRAVSQDEIREGRHLTKDPNVDGSIIAYYKFNRDETFLYDQAGFRNGNITGNAEKLESTAPVGKGVSDLIDVTSAGTYNLPNTGASLIFGSGSKPNGKIVVSHLLNNPRVVPNTEINLSRGYFIINNYGTNSTFTGLENVLFSNAGTITNQMSTTLSATVHLRDENEGLNQWSSVYTGPFNFNSGLYGGIELLNPTTITSFDKQYLINRPPFAIQQAQVSLSPYGSNTINGGNSVELLLESPYQSLILPYHDETTIELIESPTAGTMVYDTSMNAIVFFNGSIWNKLTAKSQFISQNSTIVGRGIGIDLNGSPRIESALLNLSEANGTFVLPAYTNSQILELATPVSRMLLYNSDLNRIMVFDDTRWRSIKSSPISYTSTGTNNRIDGFVAGSSIKSPSAVVEVSNSNYRTVAITQMNVAQIDNPQKGMIIYDDSRKSYLVFDGEDWGKFAFEIE